MSGKDQYNSSDLDLYVDWENAAEVCSFMEDVAGYKYKSRVWQEDNWESQLRSRDQSWKTKKLNGRVVESHYVKLGKGIAHVLDWYKEVDGEEEAISSDEEEELEEHVVRQEEGQEEQGGEDVTMRDVGVRATRRKRMKVQLIVAERSPIDLILAFHSSKPSFIPSVGHLD